MIKEFREFIQRGNVIDLAVAVIIGAAFTAIVTSLVNDIIMPLIGILLRGVNFSTWVITISGVELGVGNFIQAVINFLLIALVVFLMVRSINKMQKEEVEPPAAPPEPSDEVKLLSEIRDLLQKQD